VNIEQLERRLQSTGKECFVKHYTVFTDTQIETEKAAELLVKLEKYTLKACRTRVSNARAIIRAGRSNDAFLIIAKSGRVPDRWRDAAMRLAYR
jgi:hypothetical protein